MRYNELVYLKVANIRKDTLHELTTYLAKNHGIVSIEDLNVSGMLRNSYECEINSRPRFL